MTEKRPLGVWAQARLVAKQVRAGATYARSDSWLRQMQRIALLPEELGRALDELNASVRQTRHVAYGASRLEQQRRLGKVKEKCAPRPRLFPVARGPVLEDIGLDLASLPRSLRKVPLADLRELVAAVALRTEPARKPAMGE